MLNFRMLTARWYSPMVYTRPWKVPSKWQPSLRERSRNKDYLQIIDGFRSHVQQQIQDAEIGQESLFLLIHLIIRFGNKRWITSRMLGTDYLTQIDERRDI